jgi:hypothetical protein
LGTAPFEELSVEFDPVIRLDPITERRNAVVDAQTPFLNPVFDRSPRPQAQTSKNLLQAFAHRLSG